MPKYITQNNIKINNLTEIFLYLLRCGVTTRREIQQHTGFGWGTVSLNVNMLLEKGYIKEEFTRRNTGAGRSTACLVPDGNRFVSIGLDINRTHLIAVVIGLDGNVKDSFSLPFTATDGKSLIENTEKILKSATDYCKTKYDIFGLGIAFQGEVETDSGISRRFPGLSDGFPLMIKKHFEELLNIPVFFGHDPDCMLLSMLAQDGGKDCVLVRADDGLGMSVCQNGKLLNTDGKFELGHFLVDTEKGTVSLEKAIFDCNDLCDDAVLLKAGAILGKSLHNVCVLFSPEKIFLTGASFKNSVFSKAAIKQLDGLKCEICLKSDISAAYGAASEAIIYRIKKLFL